MINWDDFDPDDDFDPEDFGMDPDEMGKLYAIEDMKSDKKAWAVEQAYKFYDDFDSLDVDQVVKNLHGLIKDGTLRDSQINVMLENMITVFTELEEYEKCHICHQIKIKFDDRV
jgi:hypothetical protein